MNAKVVWVLVLITAVILQSCSGLTIEEKIRAKVKHFASATSGFPINCRGFVDQFVDSGILEFPQAIGIKTIVGQRNMFKFCDINIVPEVTNIETFISSDVYVHDLTAVFERSMMVVTKWRCRFIFKGITRLEFNSDMKITKMTDYFNYKNTLESYKSCTLETENEEIENKDDGTTPQFATA